MENQWIFKKISRKIKGSDWKEKIIFKYSGYEQPL